MGTTVDTFYAAVLRRGRDPVKTLRANWRMIAYLGRYAHQPFDILNEMSHHELACLAAATNWIVEEENRTTKTKGGGPG